MLERLDFAIILPKLHLVAVSELLGVFFGDIIVWANKRYCSEKLSTYPKNVRPISGRLLRHAPILKDRRKVVKNDALHPGVLAHPSVRAIGLCSQ
jgi:hypothetical protein